jgi:hypothetical protein
MSLYRSTQPTKCPACQHPLDDKWTRCSKCSYGVRPRSGRRRTVAEKLAATARCSCCGSFGAEVDRVGLPSREEGPILGSERVLLSATCFFCGAVQLYDPDRFNSCPVVPGFVDWRKDP